MIVVDHSEPEDIITMMKQSVDIVTSNLNQLNMSDYYFVGVDGVTRQYSRKQSGELLGNIDEAESQIRDYYDNADENYQIVEGIISPVSLTHKQVKVFDISKGASTRTIPALIFLLHTRLLMKATYMTSILIECSLLCLITGYSNYSSVE